MIEGDTILQTLAFGGSAGFSLGFAFLFVRWLASFIAGRQDARTAHLDGATKLLIDQLQEQVKALIEHQETTERKLAECMDRDIEKERRIAHLEGIQLGMGDARQHAALIVANEKLKDKKVD